MKSGFKERLVEYARKRHNMGMTYFERKTGISSGSISKIKDGLSTGNLMKIAKTCPDLNIRWLLIGEGNMLTCGDMIQQNGNRKIVGDNSTTNMANYFEGEKECVMMNDTMNKKLNIISEMNRSLLDRIMRIETRLDERNKLNTKLLEMISEKDALIKILIKRMKSQIELRL